MCSYFLYKKSWLKFFTVKLQTFGVKVKKKSESKARFSMVVNNCNKMKNKTAQPVNVNFCDR